MEKRVERTLKNLQKNNMQAIYAATKQEAVEQVERLLTVGETVSAGGSMSLADCGVMELLRSGNYHFLDRAAPGLSREDIQKIYREAFSADTYLTSTNALTETGTLYNVDGNGNRVAAITFGPASVIVVAGINKLVPTLRDAVLRVKQIAAPKNCVRLSCDTYCRHAGECMSLKGEQPAMTDGCGTEARICCSYVVTGYQREAGRIKVILCGEELGY